MTPQTPIADPVLDIRDLRVEFPQADVRCVIDGLDLAVRGGEIVALVGESGSGKSMTALAVMGLLPAGGAVTAGTVTFEGENLLAAPARRMNALRGHRLAMLFQQPKTMLDPTATVRSQVAEPLRLHLGLTRRQAKNRVVELLRDVGIPEPERRAGSYAHQLSGGMAQRVMIAAALSGEPSLLIADEPTTALDVTVQAQILRLLKRRQQQTGMSILLITHDLSIVSTLADRVVVMYTGRVVERGSTRDILTDPQHPYTQALVRASLLHPEHGKFFSIPGSVALSRGLDHGCRFRPRCPVADTLGIFHECEHTEPALHDCGAEHGLDHHSRCWASKAVTSK